MNTAPTPPSPGKPVSAGLFTRLIGWVKSGMLIEGPGYRLGRTPNGTRIEFLHAAPAKTKRLPGLFEPVFDKTEESPTVSFEYPYFMVGTRLYKCPDANVRDLPAQKGIYCLVMDLSGGPENSHVERYDSLGIAQQQAMLPNKSVKFLFEFGDAGTPIRDLRNMPTIATQEFGP